MFSSFSYFISRLIKDLAPGRETIFACSYSDKSEINKNRLHDDGGLFETMLYIVKYL